MPVGLRTDRTTYIGASDTARIARGDGYDVWAEKTGLQAPADLTSVFPVMLGGYTENFILDWASNISGVEILRRQEFIQDLTYPWLCCTIDGASSGSPYGGVNCVFEAKHSNAWADDQSIWDRYYWQVQHQAWVGGFTDGAIPYARGNAWGGILEIPIDYDKFCEEMLPRLKSLWECIDTDTPFENIGREAIQAPPLDGLITYDLTMDHTAYNWGPEAVKLAEAICRDRKVSQRYEDFKKELRDLCPEDARILKLPGITVRRSKTNTKSINFN